MHGNGGRIGYDGRQHRSPFRFAPANVTIGLNFGVVLKRTRALERRWPSVTASGAKLSVALLRPAGCRKTVRIAQRKRRCVHPHACSRPFPRRRQSPTARIARTKRRPPSRSYGSSKTVSAIGKIAFDQAAPWGQRAGNSQVPWLPSWPRSSPMSLEPIPRASED